MSKKVYVRETIEKMQEKLLNQEQKNISSLVSTIYNQDIKNQYH